MRMMKGIVMRMRMMRRWENKGEKVGYEEQMVEQDERCFPGSECPQREVIEI